MHPRVLSEGLKTALKLSNIDQVVAVAQEFHISVTPLGEDEYLVRIERVAPGVPLAEEQVRWPVEDWLAQARQLMNDPLMGLLQGNGAFANDLFSFSAWDEPVSPSSRNLVELGDQLYNALFQGSLRDSWMMAQAIAQNQGQVLRLRLGLKGTRLPGLPWEVLYAGDRPLATGTDVAFSRYQLSTRLWSPNPALRPQLNQPLKILMVISGPSDQETLELAQEASHLQDELKSRSPNALPAIDLTILEQPGREQLTQALEQGRYQVFHYAGHSNLGESGGDVYLVSNKTGLTETLNGDDLAGLLANNGVQLAVFNSCRGAYTATLGGRQSGQERNLAEALVKRGIPGVLAMAERIPDEVALTLTRLLYRNLNQGYPIDLSLNRARQGLISAYGSNQLYWALPVLYLHPEFNGFLTSNSPEQQEERFTLPELTDNSFPVLDDVPFPPPARSPLSVPPDDGDEPDSFFGGMDSSDSDNAEDEDPSMFIKGLLSQLADEQTSDRTEGPATNTQQQSNTRPDPAGWDLGGNPADPTPSARREALTRPSSTQPQSPTNSPNTANRRRQSPGSPWRTLRTLPKLWMILGALGVLAIALLSIWSAVNRAPRPEDLIAEPNSPIQSLPQSPANSQIVDLNTADTKKVRTIAIEHLSQGNIVAGQQAVEALLDREALLDAETALKVVEKSQLDNPAISFLRGRVAWQALKQGSRDYNISDARRYWEWAHKQQPKSVDYLTALGFAYYAEGNYDRANQAWFDALYLMEEAKAAQKATASKANKDALTTYAGLALGLRQSAQKQPSDKRATLLRESQKLRRKVIADDPINFQPDALSKNWLWTENAIRDWRSLLASKN